MAAELIYEILRDGASAETLIELPGDPPVPAVARPWLRCSYTDTDGAQSDPVAVELGLAIAVAGAAAGSSVESAVRAWPRGPGPGDDAQIVLAWLHDNVLADRLGIDTDMLVQLFIEAVVNGRDGATTCTGEHLSTIAGSADRAGTTAGSRWSLVTTLAVEQIEAVLDAIAGSGPRWRYAIVAARDADSPAGRVRQRLLDDLTR